MPVEYQIEDQLDVEGHFLFVGGPRDGEVLRIPRLPDSKFYPPHIEFPIYGPVPRFEFGATDILHMKTDVYHLGRMAMTGILLYVHESESPGFAGVIRKFMKAYAKEKRRESCSIEDE